MQFKSFAFVCGTSVAILSLLGLATQAQDNSVPTVTSPNNTSTPKKPESPSATTTPESPTMPESFSKPVTSTPTSENTSFKCIPEQDGNYVTIGQRPGGQPIPLIDWTLEGSSYYAKEYTPENRCHIVTQKLNSAVKANSGRLKNVKLTNGVVNRQSVICVLYSSVNGCEQDGSNVLFTLKPENADKAPEILGQIIAISHGQSNAGVIRETSGQTYFDLGAWENQAFEKKSSIPNSRPANSGEIGL